MSPEDTLPPMNRRADDSRITQLVSEVAVLKEQHGVLLAETKKNTEITEQVRDILASFRVIAMIAKWLTAVGGVIIMAYHGWQKLTGR